MQPNSFIKISCVCTVPCTVSKLARLAFPPKLVVTDSQAFGVVSKIVPPTVPLTSFSILMARYKGTLRAAHTTANVRT